jgi:hypothetical protein
VNGALAVIPIRAGVVDTSAESTDDGPAQRYGEVRTLPEAMQALP